MERVQRFEEAEILDYKQDEQDGFFTVEIAATRAGIMPYYDHETGEVINELKPPQEITSEATKESLKGVPVTDAHPPVMVNSENYNRYTRGMTHRDVREENSDGTTMLVVTETLLDDDLIAHVKSGNKAEVSIGFRADLKEEEGEFDGEEYQRVQENIRINHIAHTKQGRAGEKVRARIDSKHGRHSWSAERFDGYIPPNPTDYGTSTTDWEDPRPDLPGLQGLDESEREEIMRLFAWAASENPGEITNKQQDLKLPHHNTGGAVNWNGLVAAMAALQGARGGVDIPTADEQDVYDHLAAHYRNDFDEEPPDFEDVKKGRVDFTTMEMENYEFADGTEATLRKDTAEMLDNLTPAELWEMFGFDREDIEEAIASMDNIELADEVDEETEEVQIGDQTVEVSVEVSDELRSALDAVQGRLDELENLDIEKAVQQRLDLVETVKNHFPRYDARGKDAKQIKIDVIQHLNDDFDPEGKSDEYIQARFDSALDMLRQMNSYSRGDNNLRFAADKGDSDQSSIDKKRQKRKNLKGN